MTRAEISKTYRLRHPERARASRRKAGVKWRLAHPEQNKQNDRAKHLKGKYGLTPQAWDDLFARQQRQCAACKTKQGRWVTDHCHLTGKVRGILCSRCNIALGYLENTELVNQLTIYARLA